MANDTTQPPLCCLDFFGLGQSVAKALFFSPTKQDYPERLVRLLNAIAEGDETLIGTPEEAAANIQRGIDCGAIKEPLDMERIRRNQSTSRIRDRLAARELLKFLAEHGRPYAEAFRSINPQPEPPPSA
jgi:hypothetical protein